VADTCEHGNKTAVSIKCGELKSSQATVSSSIGALLHEVKLDSPKWYKLM
jgi:hypothetical protein